MQAIVPVIVVSAFLLVVALNGLYALCGVRLDTVTSPSGCTHPLKVWLWIQECNMQPYASFCFKILFAYSGCCLNDCWFAAQAEFVPEKYLVRDWENQRNTVFEKI